MNLRVGDHCSTCKPDEPGNGSRLTRIRERLRAGDYDSPAIIAEVARRILISGDLCTGQ